MEKDLEGGILLLIEEDIMNFKLVAGLGEMGIEADRYDSTVAPVVKYLLDHCEIDEDKWYDAYFGIVRFGKECNIVDDRTEVKKLAKRVLEKLNTLQ